MSLACDLRYLLEPSSFAAEVLDFEPDVWQCQALDSNRPLLLNCSRQVGKSTTASAIAIHKAMTKPDSLSLLIAPSLRQSAELFRKVTSHLRRVKDPIKRTEDNKLSLTLSNGSRIVALPSSEDTIRGFSAVDLLIEDEAAYVSDKLYTAVRPMLATTNGRHVLMSSPKGRRGHFFEEWEHGGDAWERIAVTGWDCSRIDEAFLQQERRRLGGVLFSQEYECAFISAAAGAVYQFKDGRNTTEVLPPLTDHILGIDYGFTDSTAFCILGWRNHDPTVYVVRSWKQRGLTPSAAAEIVHGLEREYHFASIVGDTGGLGKGYAEEARSRFSLPIQPAEKNNKRGYIDLLNGDFTEGRLAVYTGKPAEYTAGVGSMAAHAGGSRADERVVGRGQSQSVNTELISELRELPWNEDRTKPEEGYEDHLCDALLYGWRACRAFLAIPEEVTPLYNTSAYWEQEAKALEEREEEYYRKLQQGDDIY